MIVSAWKGGTYGIRVGRANAYRYFNKEWSDIEVEIDGMYFSFALSSTFWSTCPEFRGKAITDWLHKNEMASWPKGQPHQFNLTPLNDNKFRLTLLNDDYSNTKNQLEIES